MRSQIVLIEKNLFSKKYYTSEWELWVRALYMLRAY